VNSLSSVFLVRWPGSSRIQAGARLEAALVAAVERARAAWPALALDGEGFISHLAARIPGDAEPESALESLQVADLYLLYGCLRGDAAALAAFESAHLADLGVVARVDPSQAFVDEIRQRLRVHLFVGESPKASEYSGRGALGSWLRVVGLRLAHMMKRSTRREVVADDDSANELLAGGDPELDYIKQRYRADFVAAVREAVGGLDQRERTLLRLNLVDRLNIDKIGLLYGVHRATVASWIAAARKSILSSTRKVLEKRLSLERLEFDSLMGLVLSNLDVSLHRLLQDDSTAA
jgi:RNA polymerase sigma-70 factor (ECF subfamily)